MHPSRIIRWQLLGSCLFLFTHSPLATATATNITVDDASPGIVYSNSSQQWKEEPLGDPTSIFRPIGAFDKTWHDATAFEGGGMPQYFDFQFKGTSVYIYGIIPFTVPYTSNGLSGQLNEIYLQLFVNSTTEVAGTYLLSLNNRTEADGYIYDVLMLVKEGLPLGLHTIHVSVGQNTNFLFDYLVYTVEDGSTTAVNLSTSSSPSTSGEQPTVSIASAASSATGTSALSSSAIAGIAVCAVALVAILAVIFLLRGRRQRRKAQRSNLTEYGGSRADVNHDNVMAFPPPSYHAVNPVWVQQSRHGTGQTSPTSAPLLFSGYTEPETSSVASPPPLSAHSWDNRSMEKATPAAATFVKRG